MCSARGILLLFCLLFCFIPALCFSQDLSAEIQPSKEMTLALEILRYNTQLKEQIQKQLELIENLESLLETQSALLMTQNERYTNLLSYYEQEKLKSQVLSDQLLGYQEESNRHKSFSALASVLSFLAGALAGALIAVIIF